MIRRDRRHECFLLLCRYLGREPAPLARRVRRMEPGGILALGGHAVRLAFVNETSDGTLYTLDLCRNGRIVRRYSCLLDLPHRRRSRMVSEIIAVMLLTGITVAGVAAVYSVGAGLAGMISAQSSCDILRFDLHDVGSGRAYYIVEARNTGTSADRFVLAVIDGNGVAHPGGTGGIAEFESRTWSGTVSGAGDVYVAEVSSAAGLAVCSAKAALG